MPQSDFDRVGAAIEAEAEKQRREDDTMAQLERQIEQTWAGIAPSRVNVDCGGNGDRDLLDQTASLAALDPRVPIGSRRGLSGVKWLVRKLTYWYFRFLTDQFNVFAGMLIRHLRSLESRLRHLEAASAQPVALPDPTTSDCLDDPPDPTISDCLDDPHDPTTSDCLDDPHDPTTSDCLDDPYDPTTSDCLDDPPEPSAEVAAQVADLASLGPCPGPCLVLSGGEGTIVKAIGDRGISARGVEQDPDRALEGLHCGIDIRPGEPSAYLANAGDEGFSTIVLTGFVERLPVGRLQGVIDQASRKLARAGRIIVAVADPAHRGRVESELGSGLGISPVTWRHLLERAGFDARLEACSDSRIKEIVVAHRAEGPSDNSNRSQP